MESHPERGVLVKNPDPPATIATDAVKGTGTVTALLQQLNGTLFVVLCTLGQMALSYLTNATPCLGDPWCPPLNQQFHQTWHSSFASAKTRSISLHIVLVVVNSHYKSDTSVNRTETACSMTTIVAYRCCRRWTE